MLMNLFAHNPGVQAIAILSTLAAFVIPLMLCYNLYQRRQSFNQSRILSRDKVFDAKPGTSVKIVDNE